MRLSTLAAVAVLTVSTAALAQVARGPVEQKNVPANATTATAAADPMANAAMGNMAPAANAATPPDAKTESATPPR